MIDILVYKNREGLWMARVVGEAIWYTDPHYFLDNCLLAVAAGKYFSRPE